MINKYIVYIYLGLDPADVSEYLAFSAIFNAWDASYSQVLFTHSDTNRYISAHSITYVKNDCIFSRKLEDMILPLHKAICQKKVIAIASEKGKVSLKRFSQTNPNLKPKETLIGVYGQNHAQGMEIIFKLSLSCDNLKMLKKK